jgi:hypothetical protein
VLACLGKIELNLKLKSNMKLVKSAKKTATKTTTAPAVSAATPAVPASVSPAPAAVSKPLAKSVPTAPAKSVTPPPAKTVAPLKTTAPARVVSVKPTTIEAKIDVGFGNQLFLRGQGAGLSWDQGIPLECVDSQTWRLTVPAQEKLLFKLLINDSIWAKGEDVVVTPGQRVEITPAF